jgi:molecular chaperone GrpE
LSSTTANTWNVPQQRGLSSSRSSSTTSGGTETPASSSTEEPSTVTDQDPNPTEPPPNTDTEQTYTTDDLEEEEDEDEEPVVVEEDASITVARKQSQQLREMKEALLRSLAEQENTRTIAKRDVEQARQFAIKSFAKSLLDVADNLQRALDAVPKEYRPTTDSTATATTNASTEPLTINPDIFQTLYEGIEMTEKGLKKALENHGVLQYGTVGDVFDPNRHEALMEYPDNTKPNNTIGIVMKCGYTLHSRVLRPAEVGVVKSTLESTDATTTSAE